MRTSLAGWGKSRLQFWLALFFLAMAAPTGVLVYQAYDRLKWEAFHQQQVLAQELAGRIDRQFRRIVDREETRSFADYGFVVVAGDPSASFLQRSVLSGYPVSEEIPGLVGHFQVDAAGELATPLLPQAGTDPAQFGVSTAELAQRTALADRLRRILGENRLVAAAPGAGRAGASAAAGHERRGRDAGGGRADVPPERPAMRADAEGPAEKTVMPQAAFDRLGDQRVKPGGTPAGGHADSFGRVEDLALDDREQRPASAPVVTAADTPDRQQQAVEGIAGPPQRAARKERRALPEPPAPLAASPPMADEPQEAGAVAAPRIRIFESEVDPFELALLDSGHFVLFRKVWRDGQRFIQGALVEAQPLLRGVVEASLRETLLSRTTDLAVAWQEQVIAVFSGPFGRESLASAGELRGAALYQTRLSAPLDNMTLLFRIHRLPPGPGGAVIGWVAAILVVVLCAGFFAMYRLGVRQIELARQQQDFVSAVSHELKTPLTSVRMYAEMLREGWVSEDRRRRYYEYIHDESERLSRLIANVLQLARMTRNELTLDTRQTTAGELMDGVRSKVASQAEHAGFALQLQCADDASSAVVEMDPDAFLQVVINLVDNAIKFSASADRKEIDIRCDTAGDGTVRFSVRDYGPGVPRDQMKKIFGLFYRSGNELTRDTAGTGIGLALVQQLVQAMKGRVDVVNRERGAEFRLSFPARLSAP